MSLEDDARAPQRSTLWEITGRRFPLLVFAIVEVAAFPVLLHTGRRRWFWADDWFFLVSTTRGGFKTLLKTNTYGHWLTLPILAYRLLWWLVGLRHFTAYLVLVMVLHLTTAALLRAVMRRAGVGPWIATLVASMFVFFGAGVFDMVVPVQISFNGSLVLGLTHLLLADHDGAVNRRDVIGLVCGLAGLMCSNVSIAMVATVGLAVLLRRGWRAALLHTVPLGAIYFAWWSFYAKSAHDLMGRRASFGQLVPFVWRGLRTTFEGLGHSPIAGLGLVAILGIGAVLAWVRAADGSRRRIAAPIALVSGAVIFIASAGLIRASPAISPGSAGSFVSRYIYVSAALLLPALAVGATALTRRWRQLVPIVTIVLIVGLPGNFHEVTSYSTTFGAQYKHTFLVFAHSPVARRLPPFLRVPIPGSPGYMYAGWLVSGVKSGRIPGIGAHVSARDAATAALTLALSPYQITRMHARCRLVTGGSVVLHVGDELLATKGDFKLVYVTDSGAKSAPLPVIAPQRFQDFAQPLSLRVSRAPDRRRSALWQCAALRRPAGSRPAAVRNIGSLAFVDAKEGFGAEYLAPTPAAFALARTDDGGRTWQRRGRLPAGDDKLMFAPVYAAGSTGLVAWGNGSLSQSSDGGMHWSTTLAGVVSSVSEASFRLWASVVCPSGSASPCTPRLATSVDGGRTWKDPPTPLQLRSGATSIASPSGSSVYLVDGELAFTHDYGTTWAHEPLPAACAEPRRDQTLDIQADVLLLICSPPRGPVAGPAPRAFVSADEGRTWQTTLPFSPKIGFDGVSSATDAGFVVGGPGPARVTTDNGKSWHDAFPLPPGGEVVAIDREFGVGVWAAAAVDGIWFSADGVHWEKR